LFGCYEMEGWNWKTDWAAFENSKDWYPDRLAIGSGIARDAKSRVFKGEWVWKIVSQTGITEGTVVGSLLLCYGKRLMDQMAGFQFY
jgi:hypothetical protein